MQLDPKKLDRKAGKTSFSSTSSLLHFQLFSAEESLGIFERVSRESYFKQRLIILTLKSESVHSM